MNLIPQYTSADQITINKQAIQNKIKEFKENCNNEETETENQNHLYKLHLEIQQLGPEYTDMLSDVSILFVYLCLARKILAYSVRDVDVLTKDYSYTKAMNWCGIYKTNPTYFQNINTPRIIQLWLLGLAKDPFYDRIYDDFDVNSICNIRRCILNFELYKKAPPKKVYLACSDDISFILGLLKKPNNIQDFPDTPKMYGASGRGGRKLVTYTGVPQVNITQTSNTQQNNEQETQNPRTFQVLNQVTIKNKSITLSEEKILIKPYAYVLSRTLNVKDRDKLKKVQQYGFKTQS